MCTRPLLALAVASIWAVGCSGKSSPPPPPPPPNVEVLPHQSPAIDTHFDVDVNVTGCDSVAKVTLSDGQSPLATATDAASRTTFTIQSNQVNYKSDGVAAALVLTATATCANGQVGHSGGAGQIFLPAAKVFTGSFPFPSLAIDPDGNGLVTCVGGPTGLVTHLNTDGQILAQAQGIGCSARGYLLRVSANELYWIEPDAVYRLDASLRVLGTPVGFSTGTAFVSPDVTAPAVFFSANGAQMVWLDRTSGSQELVTGLDTASTGNGAALDGQPAFGNTGLLVPEAEESLDMSQIALQVERFDHTSGQSQGLSVLATVPVTDLGLANVPRLNLSPSGAVAYFVAGANENQLWACTVDAPQPCGSRSNPGGGGLLTGLTLPGGPYVLAQPLGDFIVVAGPSGVLFTDMSGTPVSNAMLTPTGSLQVLGVYPGAGDQFYVVDGDAQGNALEVVMLDSPGHEAARFHVDTGTIGFDLDQHQVPYLLANGKVAKLLTPDQYAAARQ